MKLGDGSTRAWLAGLACATVVVGFGVTVAPGCIFAFSQSSLGQGTGCVTGVLDVPNCWSGNFNLNPDFFVAVPSQASLEIRVQRGSDYETFSDGLAILVDDVNAIRPGGDAGVDGGGLFDQPLPVSIPAGVTAPGVPLVANPNPSLVHVSMYLQSSCQTQNVSLYALDQVTLGADGSCNGVAATASTFVCGPVLPDAALEASMAEASAPEAGSSFEAGAGDGGSKGPATDAGAAPLPVGRSTMVFHELFDGNPDESSADQRLTQATFDLYLADPRTVAPGGLGPPPACQAHIQGSFRFYFQRGQPAQPFP